MTEPAPSLSGEQERMLLDLMVGTFDIPDGRAKLYILRFREMALEQQGDELLAQAAGMGPRLAQRAVEVFLERVRTLDEQFKEAQDE